MKEKSMEGTSQSAFEKLTMRCPVCQKLYSVKAEVVLSSSGPLAFNCVNCRTKFSATVEAFSGEASTGETPTSGLNMITAVLKLPEMDFKEPEIQSEDSPRQRPQQKPPQTARSVLEKPPLERSLETEVDCPRCGARNGIGESECPSCGVVFSKYKTFSYEDDTQEIREQGRYDLAELWSAIMADYTNEALHEKFIMTCDRADCLSFAARKYASILSVTPQEDFAKRMKKRIVALASHRFETLAPQSAWQFRVPLLVDIVIVMASAVATMGLMVPGLAYLTAIGVVTLILTIGLRFFLRPPVR